MLNLKNKQKKTLISIRLTSSNGVCQFVVVAAHAFETKRGSSQSCSTLDNPLLH